MAEDSPNRVGWLLELHREHSDWLAGIRHWSHLKVATEEAGIWVSGFSDAEIESTAVKSIPAKKIWYQQDNQLFPQGSRLPFRKAPMLLWTPIERGLSLTLPDENHNLFSTGEAAPVRLVRTQEVHPAAAMMTSFGALQSYIEKAAAVRIKNLRWTIINGNAVLITGIPLLPIPGNAYWQRGRFLVPAGFNFEWPVITTVLDAKMGLASNDVIVWNEAGGWFRVPGAALRPLTIGSFRQSALLLQAKTGSAL